MEILATNIAFCFECNNHRGSVEEKYNGTVPVHCACDLTRERELYGKWRSPCMMCPNGKKFYWVPISDHKEADGEWWHTPYFGGPAPNSKTRINPKI